MTRPITFLSDYGTEDEFAGVCRAVIARIAPHSTVIDLTHGVARHDVAAGADLLARALPFAPPGVHLAVVDPGVGSERKAVAVRVAEEERVLVGPDNGLLAAAIGRFGGAVEVVEVSRSPVRLEPVSATFHGRDVFAPVAAHLALGAEPATLGEPFDPADLVTLARPEPVVEPGDRIEAAVSGVDRFGNVALALDEAHVLGSGLKLGRGVAIEAGGARAEAVYAFTFADVDAGESLVYLNSSGRLGVAVNRGSAAKRFGLAAGDCVVLRPL